MFQKYQPNEKTQEETLIAPGVKVEGEVVSRGDIRVEGEVHGSIKTEQNLRVGQHSKIFANIKALSVFISGTVVGNLKIKERLELMETATVVGDVEAKSIIISEGGVVHGKIEMLQEAKLKELKIPTKVERLEPTAAS